MKKNSLVILALLSACSIILNIVLIALLVNKNENSYINKITGIYQAQYYNSYNNSMTIMEKKNEKDLRAYVRPEVEELKLNVESIVCGAESGVEEEDDF